MNQKETKRRWLKFLPWLMVITVILATLPIISCSSSNTSVSPIPSPTASATVPAGTLQLKDLQIHPFKDLGVSIEYPSEWANYSVNGSAVIVSQNLCLDTPLFVSLSQPFNSSKMGYQNYTDSFIQLFMQKRGDTVVSNKTITVNGTSMRELITSNGTYADYYLYNVLIFIPSKEQSLTGLITFTLRADCWLYYEDAINKIASTYQFLK
jgi:hypothetical protein